MKPPQISYPFSRLLQARDARAEPGPYPIDLLINCLFVGLPKRECKFPLSFISHPCPLPSLRAPTRFALLLLPAVAHYAQPKFISCLPSFYCLTLRLRSFALHLPLFLPR